MTTETRFELLPLAKLHESSLNPRKHFDKKKLDELIASVRVKGVQTPLIVRPNADGFEIAAGHRRFRAATAAKLPEVPVFIRTMTDDEFLELLNFENLLREDVHPLEEADGYRTLMEKSGYDASGIAAKIGKSVAYVYARLKLADLVEPARKAFLAEELTAGHAILLARLQPKDQAEALKANIRENYVDSRNHANGQRVRAVVSVREFAAWIQTNVHLDLATAPFPTDDPELVKAAGACTTCPKRTGNSPELFPDVKKGDTCTDPGCYQGKRDAALERQLAALPVKSKPVTVTEEYYASQGFHRGQWHAAKAESCDGVRPAVNVSKNEALLVCTNQKCKVHFRLEPGSSSSGSSSYAAQARKAQQRAAAETKIRKAILVAILPKVEAALPRPVLELIAQGFANDVWHEAQRDLVAVLGWGGEKKTHVTNVIGRRIPKTSAKELSQTLVALAVARNLHANAYGSSQPEQLLAMAKAYKVDAAKIRRDAAAAKKVTARKPSKAKAKKSKPVQTSTKGKGKKRR